MHRLRANARCDGVPAGAAPVNPLVLHAYLDMETTLNNRKLGQIAYPPIAGTLVHACLPGHCRIAAIDRAGNSLGYPRYNNTHDRPHRVQSLSTASDFT
ncbi:MULTISPECIES: hypothetical protein [unclassified Salinisphaera]|uniref:hypothetical protein n=1 Tax=unclassified Salinisphaera TaxID=2649847 RepID=UPI00334056C4